MQITIDNSRFLAGAWDKLQSAVFNRAQSETGFPYFRAVDRGRRAVFPIRAKALRIPVGGGFIFRKFAGPAAPRNITTRSLEDLVPNAQFAAAFSSGGTLAVWAASFLNAMARLQANSLAERTPIKTGNLAGSYEVQKAAR